jgi:hypothetical protein
LQVQSRIIVRQRHDHGIDERRVQELAAPAVGIAVHIEVIALADHPDERDDLTVTEGLLPCEFGNAKSVHARPDAGGVGDGPKVGPGRLPIPGGSKTGLGLNLRADPACRAGIG